MNWSQALSRLYMTTAPILGAVVMAGHILGWTLVVTIHLLRSSTGRRRVRVAARLRPGCIRHGGHPRTGGGQ
jgi:hypothetical protein